MNSKISTGNLDTLLKVVKDKKQDHFYSDTNHYGIF